MVVDPEEHELQDLQYLVELDARLMEEGLPHLLDILDPDRLPALIEEHLRAPSGRR